MLVQQLLLETLDDLGSDDFKTFKWYLSLNTSDSCKKISKSRLEAASRIETVSEMVKSYGEESAVSTSFEILRKMNFNGAAGELVSKYAVAVRNTATPSTSSSAGANPAAPLAAATVSAQQGSVIIAPTVTGYSSSGTWNININK